MLQRFENMNGAAQAWIVVGGLFLLLVIYMVIREIPAMRRELKIYNMGEAPKKK